MVDQQRIASILGSEIVGTVPSMHGQIAGSIQPLLPATPSSATAERCPKCGAAATSKVSFDCFSYWNINEPNTFTRSTRCYGRQIVLLEQQLAAVTAERDGLRQMIREGYNSVQIEWARCSPGKRKNDLTRLMAEMHKAGWIDAGR